MFRDSLPEDTTSKTDLGCRRVVERTPRGRLGRRLAKRPGFDVQGPLRGLSPGSTNPTTSPLKRTTRGMGRVLLVDGPGNDPVS